MDTQKYYKSIEDQVNKESEDRLPSIMDDEYEEIIRISCFKDGAKFGVSATYDTILKFAEYCSEFYIKCNGGWVINGRYGKKGKIFKTNELFEKFLEYKKSMKDLL